MAEGSGVSVRDILYAVGTETACWRNDMGKRISLPRHGMQERLALERDLLRHFEYQNRLQELAYFIRCLGVLLQTDRWAVVHQYLFDLRHVLNREHFLARFEPARTGVAWNGLRLLLEPGEDPVVRLSLGEGHSWAIPVGRMSYLNLLGQVVYEMAMNPCDIFGHGVLTPGAGAEEIKQAVSLLAKEVKVLLETTETPWSAVENNPQHLCRRFDRVKAYLQGRFGEMARAEQVTAQVMFDFWRQYSLEEQEGTLSDKGHREFVTILEMFNKVIALEESWREWAHRDDMASLGQDRTAGNLDLERWRSAGGEQDEEARQQAADLLAGRLLERTNPLARVVTHGETWGIKYFKNGKETVDFLAPLFQCVPLVERNPELVLWVQAFGGWQYNLGRRRTTVEQDPAWDYTTLQEAWRKMLSMQENTLRAIVYFLFFHRQIEALTLGEGRENPSLLERLKSSPTFAELLKQEEKTALDREFLLELAEIFQRTDGAQRDRACTDFIHDNYPSPASRLRLLAQVLMVDWEEERARHPDSQALFESVLLLLLPILRHDLKPIVEDVWNDTSDLWRTRIEKAYKDNGHREGFPKLALGEAEERLVEGQRGGGTHMKDLVQKVAWFNTILSQFLRNVDEQYQNDMRMFREHFARLYPTTLEN